jgi:hypothetical protein
MSEDKRIWAVKRQQTIAHQIHDLQLERGYAGGPWTPKEEALLREFNALTPLTGEYWKGPP